MIWLVIGLGMLAAAIVFGGRLQREQWAGLRTAVRWASGALLAIIMVLLLARGQILPALLAGSLLILSFRVPFTAKWGSAKNGTGERGRLDMSLDEAREVLGLSAGATADEIRDAHRRLIVRLHPDHGGSDYLAAKINRAKDVLLNGS